MEGLERRLQAAERVITWLGIVVMVAMLIIAVGEIIARDLFDDPIAGSLDLTLLIMIWMVLLVSGAGVRSDLHIRVEFFVSGLPPIPKRILSFIVDLLILYFGFEMATEAIPLVKLPGIMPELGISNSWLYIPLIIGGILTMAAAVERMLRIIVSFRKSGEK
jgi:TRAP-type C4-dicarboxylate transport system permease small subunit